MQQHRKEGLYTLFYLERNMSKIHRTLIVEDNATFRQILVNLLSYQFPLMEVAEAEDSLEAFKIIHEFSPDIIFFDIKLPGESGLELTKKVKIAYPDIVVVILTSYDMPEYRKAATQYGADYFFSKGSPSVANSVLALIEDILSGAAPSN
ncbi:Response regulator receiver protein (modular protein) [uncultured Desulfobacterium sp.]|uniref:Response regulator receiver protein (Modular protein) n=1 Tax=uncultured Desulfobacterium sp. TaxID=201089 RepID=A0A445N350_9BACT|nr:Response regulator receiver protein (modular protein) [uncultured Desulfobacterium sp.]